MERNTIRVARRWLQSVAPQRSTLKTDALAGLPGAIGSVPDGMAASVLAGVNPIHGLYASFAGPVAGGLTASTKLMVITTTSAAALAAVSALEKVSPEDRPAALFLLTLIAAAAMIAAGLLRLGRFTRFVSHVAESAPNDDGSRSLLEHVEEPGTVRPEALMVVVRVDNADRCTKSTDSAAGTRAARPRFSGPIVN